MFCISNVIIWGYDGGGVCAYKVTGGRKLKTKRKCLWKSQLSIMGFFYIFSGALAPVAVVEGMVC